MFQHHIDAAVFLAAQGLAFRGHDKSKCSSNRGNFIELMDLLGEYSSELRSFLNKERITYTSQEPQNDLIECVYEEVKTEIQKRIDNSNFIAVMMDDTSDCSNIEQSAVSVRLINNDEIEEHLLGMIDSSDDQSADALTNILMDTLKKYKITPEKGKEKLYGGIRMTKFITCKLIDPSLQNTIPSFQFTWLLLEIFDSSSSNTSIRDVEFMTLQVISYHSSIRHHRLVIIFHVCIVYESCMHRV